MQKWANFARNFTKFRTVKTFLFLRKFSTYVKLFFSKIFANVFAKTKNLTKFDSDTACMGFVVSCYIKLHFGRIKITYCMCSKVETKIFVFEFSYFRETFFTKIDENSGTETSMMQTTLGIGSTIEQC
jgi:hypothetical protein